MITHITDSWPEDKVLRNLKWLPKLKQVHSGTSSSCIFDREPFYLELEHFYFLRSSMATSHASLHST